MIQSGVSKAAPPLVDREAFADRDWPNPENAGIWAALNFAATQPPTAVPANGGWSTSAEETDPLGAKVTFTCPLPVGPSGFCKSLPPLQRLRVRPELRLGRRVYHPRRRRRLLRHHRCPRQPF